MKECAKDLLVSSLKQGEEVESMDKMWVLDMLRSRYPDLKPLKCFLAKCRVKRTGRTILPEKEVILAEQDAQFKTHIVERCAKRWPKAYRLSERTAKRLLAKAPSIVNRADKDALLWDMLFCRFAYGFEPDEYLCYELEGKSTQERRTIVSDVDRYCYVYRMNDISDAQIFNNKGRTYELFKDYYKRDALYISKRGDYEKFCAFVRKHSTFVRKAVYEGMGRSIALVDMTTTEMSERELFRDMISRGPHLLEERVIQDDTMAALNSSSVNTIRCITLNTKHGVIAPYCFLKVGRAGAFVDNGGAGGILVGIDRETGRLNTDGYDELNIRYETHPDTGIPFRGYQLPEWKQMIEMCLEMSAKTPSVKFIGWDLAHTEDGWIVIEGNGKSQLIGPQTVWKDAIDCKKAMEEYMKDMDLFA